MTGDPNIGVGSMVAQARFRTAAKLFTIFHFCGPQKPLYASRGGGVVGGRGGGVTVSLRGLRYSEKACNFPQFRREFAHTSPTRTRQPPIGARRLTQQLVIELALFHKKRNAFLKTSISLSLSLSLSSSISLPLALPETKNR